MTDDWRNQLGCIEDDPCAYDHTCTNHRLVADLVAAKDAQIAALEIAISQERGAVTDLARERDALEQARIEAVAHFQGVQAERNDLREQIAALEVDLDGQRGAYVMATRENGELKQKIAALEARVESLQTLISDFHEAIGGTPHGWSLVKEVKHKLAALETEVGRLRQCRTCGGVPHPSGKVCICDGTNFVEEEIRNLRLELFAAEQDLAPFVALARIAEKHLDATAIAGNYQSATWIALQNALAHPTAQRAVTETG